MNQTLNIRFLGYWNDIITSDQAYAPPPPSCNPKTTNTDAKSKQKARCHRETALDILGIDIPDGLFTGSGTAPQQTLTDQPLGCNSFVMIHALSASSIIPKEYL